MARKRSDISVTKSEIAWENRRHFATPRVVSPRNNVWEMSAEIPYLIMMTRHYLDLGSAFDWSCCVGNLLQTIRSATQIWVVTRRQYGISRSFLRHRKISQANSETLRFHWEGGMQAVCDRKFSFAKTLPSRRPELEETISSILNAAQRLPY